MTSLEPSAFELTNHQREYFGLDPIEKHWDKVTLKGDTYRPSSFLYFDGDTIKRHIISTESRYREVQYDEMTRGRIVLLPKTSKGKEKKLTASVLENRTPVGVYLDITNYGDILIGNYSTQTTFYSRRWEPFDFSTNKDVPGLIATFLEASPPNHLKEIGEFKNAKKKHVQFSSGDYFAFKLNRSQFGFGRVLLHIDKVRKKGLIHSDHGLYNIMGPPVLVQLFAYASDAKKVDIKVLDNTPVLPSDIMMDNLLYYGEYEIVGHRDLREDEFEFPISYGRNLNPGKKNVFLQWGLIHKELPSWWFGRYISAENPFVDESSPSRHVHGPYRYDSIGFRPKYDSVDVLNAINGIGVYDAGARENFAAEFDLRNPKNAEIRKRILKVFGLKPDLSYVENCKRTGTPLTTEIIKGL